ncbi:MAG: hypothetical protein ACR2OG_05210 [Gemmatimonadaceae bacterium]
MHVPKSALPQPRKIQISAESQKQVQGGQARGASPSKAQQSTGRSSAGTDRGKESGTERMVAADPGKGEVV